MQDRAFNKEIGLVRATKHYLVSIEGLPTVRVYDLVVNEDGARALVTSLSHDAVEAMMLDSAEVRPGQRFEHASTTAQLSVGPHLFGRVVNALGDPIDDKGGFPPKNLALVLEHEPGDLARRAPITQQLVTGYSLIDTVLPIGKGQRQLLMGPIQSGTDAFCRQAVLNQRKSDMVCIYAAIGKPVTFVQRLAEALFTSGAEANTVILAATSDDPAPLNTIAPAVALLVAEHFANEGQDVLLIMNDLYTHAKYLREVGLLEGRLPGRESYPGDIFYQQAHLIERAGSFVTGGSITLLPVLQTDLESYTDLIMTNIMGTTDGHLLFSPKRYAQGTFPPVDEEASVTRVGKHAQTLVQKQLSTSIISLLAEAAVQERYTQFGSQVSDTTREMLDMGRNMRVLLDQEEEDALGLEGQAVLLSLVLTTFGNGKDEGFFRTHYKALRDIAANAPDLEDVRAAVRTDATLEAFLARLEECLASFEQACQK